MKKSKDKDSEIENEEKRAQSKLESEALSDMSKNIRIMVKYLRDIKKAVEEEHPVELKDGSKSVKGRISQLEIDGKVSFLIDAEDGGGVVYFNTKDIVHCTFYRANNAYGKAPALEIYISIQI